MKTLFRMTGILMIMVLVACAVAAQDDITDRVGEVVALSGHVLDVNGDPIEGAVVELWQTDVNGNYNHPNDISDESELLPDFQYFGVSITDEAGAYRFVTVKPSAYENRPPHLHFKVKLDGEEVLTSQFYFEEDAETVQNEGVFQAGGNANLILTLEDDVDENDNPIRVAEKDIVVSLDGSEGELAVTPSQSEGPYYPVIDFSEYDNDLTSLVDAAEFTLINLNTATEEEIMTIPGMSGRMVREFEEYRPYVSIVQFRREIGKYVDEEQVAAYEDYVYVPVDVNESDAETLKQIPGVDDDIAAALMENRPYESNEAFLEALGEHLSEAEVEMAAHYLADEE